MKPFGIDFSKPAYVFEVSDIELTEPCPPVTRKGMSIVTPDWDAIKRAQDAQFPSSKNARNSDPHTSHEAAASLQHLARKHRAGCLAALAIYGPQTGHEIAARLGLRYDQVSKRLPELEEQGTIERRKVAGLYHTRLSPSRRPACVWYVVGTLI